MAYVIGVINTYRDAQNNSPLQFIDVALTNRDFPDKDSSLLDRVYETPKASARFGLSARLKVQGFRKFGGHTPSCEQSGLKKRC